MTSETATSTFSQTGSRELGTLVLIGLAYMYFSSVLTASHILCVILGAIGGLVLTLASLRKVLNSTGLINMITSMISNRVCSPPTPQPLFNQQMDAVKNAVEKVIKETKTESQNLVKNAVENIVKETKAECTAPSSALPKQEDAKPLWNSVRCNIYTPIGYDVNAVAEKVSSRVLSHIVFDVAASTNFEAIVEVPRPNKTSYIEIFSNPADIAKFATFLEKMVMTEL